MPQCLVIDAAGAVTASDAVPCPGVLAFTPPEYAYLTQNPFVLTPEQGTLIATAVVAVWGAAYAFKVFVRTLNDDGMEK